MNIKEMPLNAKNCLCKDGENSEKNI